MDLTVLPLKPDQINVPDGNFGFGDKFTNRMFKQYYDPENGWHKATIGPYEPFVLPPSTAVFHYAQAIFEGSKAYRRPDGQINIFRLWDNMERFNRSAERMAMPMVDVEDHLEAIMQLVALEAEWVPDVPGAALYIRPTMIATDSNLGVAASKSYVHFVIVGPVGPYFKGGLNPVAVYIEQEYRRAVKGGVGAAKTAGNYAASLYATSRAKEAGYAQVLWLDAIEGRFIEEVGAMNICFVYEGRHIVTPQLSGSILPGITRMSVMKLGAHLGYETSEIRLDVNEVMADIDAGKITEVFGCGTAAVIAPVGRLGFGGRDYIINNDETGPVARHIYDELTGLQVGRKPDPFGWTRTVPLGGS